MYKTTNSQCRLSVYIIYYRLLLLLLFSVFMLCDSVGYKSQCQVVVVCQGKLQNIQKITHHLTVICASYIIYLVSCLLLQKAKICPVP